MMDGVPSKVNVFLAESVYPVSMFFLQMVSNPGHGTRIARGWEWYKSDQHESMLIKFTCRYSSHWCHKS